MKKYLKKNLNAEVESYAEIIQVMVYEQDNKMSEIIEF